MKESTGTHKKESSHNWLGSPCGVGAGGRQGTGEPGFGSFCEFSSAASRRGKGGVEACATDLFLRVEHAFQVRVLYLGERHKLLDSVVLPLVLLITSK